MRPGPSVLRSRETWYWSALAADRGGREPQSSSISLSAETASFAEVSRRTSSARRLEPPRASAPSRSTTSIGPRIRNSILRPGADPSTQRALSRAQRRPARSPDEKPRLAGRRLGRILKDPPTNDEH